MTRTCKVIRSLITIFINLVQLCLALDKYFQECEPRKCGGLTITYPFYIQDQQKSYCGYPGFQVTCNSQSYPILNLSDNGFIIREIFYNNQSFHTINSAFLDTSFDCNTATAIHNISLGDRFTYSFNHSDIFFLQNCSNESITSLVQYKEFVCHNNNKTRGVYAAYAQDINMKKFAGKCEKVVLVPYEGQRGSDVEAMLAEGLLLNWRASNCSKCTNSGGRCSFDETTHQTQCFCSHGVHSHSCPKNRMRLILGLGIAGGALMFAVVIAIWCRKKLRFGARKFAPRSASLGRSDSDVEKGNIYFGVPLFSYIELQEATDNFDQLKELGDGGFGTVYYGKLKDGREVAVKRLYEKNYKRVEQFMNEVQILTRLRHQNLVSLYGCTSHHSKELLLVYEFICNGTVADHLYGDKSKPEPLPWPIRLRIAIETASALCYLHASDIIHRDVKTNNILLDSNFNVKVADFGLSRLFPNHVSHVSTAPQGTPGYLDPEYHQCYQLTGKSDVYSFGVVLIELISSLPAVDMSRHRHEINLSNYAMTRIQRCAFDELVDPELGFRSDFKVRRMTTAVGELAFQCLQHDKEFRPPMNEVLEILKRIESTDYDALQAEEMAENSTGSKSTDPPPSPIEDDHAKLLKHHPFHPSSPDTVMDKWASKSTTPSTSK